MLIFNVASECGTDISPAEVARQEGRFRLLRQLRGPAETYVFPLYYHVVAQDETFAGGWLQDETVHQMVSLLNNGFVGTGVSFRLEGIGRHLNSTWFRNADNKQGVALEREMKERTRVGGGDSLNVWTVGMQGPDAPAGYAKFPWNFENDRAIDGVVVKWSLIPGGSPRRSGKTLIHEAGHWVGLYHTFQGTKGCTGDGDSVADTPMQGESTSLSAGCGPSDTCPDQPGDDPVFNYMDYSSDECRSLFTPGQIERMKQMLSTYRAPSAPSVPVDQQDDE
ncbi:hypothetical protein FA15DRAFT_587695 [Coprinopsis marcescibilis]|uniref:Peptidase M43 pregnancy-associated plasma-A domain-containing protein n=1 Tax=Coprinopsis marcescibilis TaxID=230819 RepID=A0A5C3L2G8_COPMA|nr:hypothetical protein FA15DRAFT_587695 [Coprinopsis marcescibilis]